MDRIIQMIINSILHRLINRGVNAGVDAVARRAKSAARPTDPVDAQALADQKQAQEAKDIAKRARQAANLARRMGR